MRETRLFRSVLAIGAIGLAAAACSDGNGATPEEAVVGQIGRAHV